MQSGFFVRKREEGGVASVRERKLGYWETLNALVHDHTEGHGNLTCVVRLRMPLALENTRQTLQLLFRRHPLLRATIQAPMVGPEDTTDASYYHFKFDTVDFDKIPIVEQTVAERRDWKRAYKEELHVKFPFPEYLWRVRILQVEDDVDSSYLLFSATHAAFDALSVAQLLKEFLDLYSQMAMGRRPEICPLGPQQAIEALLDKQKFTAACPDYLAKSSDSIDEDSSAAADFAVASWPFSRRADIKSRRTDCVTSIVDLPSLKAACDGHGAITVNSAINAALLLAMKGHVEADVLRTQLCTPIDLRRYCRERPLDIENLGCNVTMVATNHVIGAESVFWEVAEDYQLKLNASIVKAGSYPDSFKMQDITSYYKQCLEDRDGFFMGFGVTNLGALKRLVDLPERSAALIDDFHIAASRQAGDFACLVCVATIGETIYVDFTFTEPLMDREIMNRIADGFVETLGQNLGLTATSGLGGGEG